MRREWVGAIALSVLTCLVLSPSADAQVAFVKIEGDPLTIHVGEDLSFQIFNAEVPGSGQIFPTACVNTADMGIFAEIDGILFAPDFSNHGCGTATGNLGERTPWTPIFLSDVEGTGIIDDPFRVTAVVSAPGRSLQVRMQVTYVNGQNFFRIKKSINSFQRPRSIKVWDAADIYLASSDAGVYTFEDSLGAPGGNDCSVPVTYSILMIPATRATLVAANQYATVWQMIGDGQLDGTITPEGCVDNGAAIQWDLQLASGVPQSVKSAISFGAIPSAANFQLLTIRVTPPVEAINGETVSFIVETFPDEDIRADVNLWLGQLPEGFTASVAPEVVEAPGYGTSVLTVTVGPEVLPGTYLIPIHGETAGESGFTSAAVDVVCDPPVILGRASDQPQSQTVQSGGTATLSVTTARSGAFTYQWYRGHSGLTKFPVEGATSSTFTTPPIDNETSFWVRVSSPCGTTDSWAATITPIGGKTTPPGRRRGVRPGSNGSGGGSGGR